MAGILKNNIKAFDKLYPYVNTMLETAGKNEDKKKCLDKNGKIYFEFEEENYRICSSNPLGEAELLMHNIDFDRDNLIIIFGVGNVEFLEEMVEKSSEGTRIAVFEPNDEVFRYIMKKHDLCNIINSHKLVFFVGEPEDTERYIQFFFESWINLILNMQVISLPNYYLYGDFKKKCIDVVSKIFLRQFANMGNSLEDTMIGIDNQYVNVDNCMLSNSINELQDKFEGYPAIIVSSGPSLDKNIDKLKAAEGKALIISCDASYRTLCAYDIKPHMIASLERGIETYQYYYENQEFPEDLILVGPSVLRPEIFASIPGKKIIMAKSGIGVEGWWKNQFDSIEFRDLGHSCATAAFAAAQAAGCSPIILIGQDLAYTDDKIHGDMAHTKYEGDNKRIATEREFWTKDIYGNPIQTSDVYNTFRYFFENKIVLEGVKIVDATEGGALIKGSDLMTLEDAIKQYCTRDLPYNATDLLEDRNIDSEYKLKKYLQIIDSIDDYINELKEVQKKTQEYHKGIIHYKDYDFDTASEEDLIEVLEILTENNQIIPYLYGEHKNLLNYYMQNIRQTIINVKNLGNKITGKNVHRNWVLQINLIEMIDLASSVVINEFMKIQEFMREKAEKEKKDV